MPLDQETLNQLVASIRRFVDDRLIPREAEVAETDAMPADVVAEMREMGLFGLSIAPEYGGLGLTMEEEARVIFEGVQVDFIYAGINDHQGSGRFPRHSHPFTELFYTVSGEGTMMCGSRTERCRAGHVFLARPGVPHVHPLCA